MRTHITIVCIRTRTLAVVIDQIRELCPITCNTCLSVFYFTLCTSLVTLLTHITDIHIVPVTLGYTSSFLLQQLCSLKSGQTGITDSFTLRTGFTREVAVDTQLQAWTGLIDFILYPVDHLICGHNKVRRSILELRIDQISKCDWYLWPTRYRLIDRIEYLYLSTCCIKHTCRTDSNIDETGHRGGWAVKGNDLWRIGDHNVSSWRDQIDSREVEGKWGLRKGVLIVIQEWRD